MHFNNTYSIIAHLGHLIIKRQLQPVYLLLEQIAHMPSSTALFKQYHVAMWQNLFLSPLFLFIHLEVQAT